MSVRALIAERGWRVIRPTLVIAGALLVLIPLYRSFVPYSLRWNSTPSIPVGLYLAKDYVEQDLKPGDLVCFRFQPPSWAEERRYAPPGHMFCKPVAGQSGDTLEVADGKVTVRNAANANRAYPLRAFDSKGRSMPQDVLTSGVIPEGQLALLSSYRVDSLDSRYLGLIPRTALTYRVWPLLVKD